MENRGLIFIPDISGFTKFVNELEINHSRMIIQELLETIIASNKIGLVISEIEGDAVLFYKFGDTPKLEEVYAQVSEMFRDFHKQLIAYDHRKFCQCKACTSAINLTLKIISHYGEFTEYSVQNFNKLIGKDIIVAHQLLKNDIPQHEYWLVTNPLLNEGEPSNMAEWMKWNVSKKETESGDVNFHYTQLAPLREGLHPDPMPMPELSDKRKILSVSRDYDHDIIYLFHATGDFNYRGKWMEGVESVEEVNHFLPRIGMKCRMVSDDGQAIIFITSYSYSDDRIAYSEIDEGGKKMIYHTLEKLGDNKTRFTIDYYTDATSTTEEQEINQLKSSLTRSMENLDKLMASGEVE